LMTLAWASQHVAQLVPMSRPYHARALAIGWCSLSTLLLLVLVWSNVRLARERRTWHASSIQRVPVLISNGFGPALVGVLRPSIVVPPWVLSLDPIAQRAVLAHESEHRRAGDQWLLCAAVCAIVVMPWNIGLWLIWRRLARAIELDGDERVLHRGFSAAEYANVLLGAWQRARGGFPWVSSPAFAEHVSGLGRRVEHLLRPTPRRWRMKTFTGSIVAALLVVVALAVPAPQYAQGAPVAAPLPSSALPQHPVVAVAQPTLEAQRVVTARQASAVVASRTSTPAGAATLAAVQPQRGRILIVVPLDTTGRKFSQYIRRSVEQDIVGKTVTIIAEQDYEETLAAAGFAVTSKLSEQDLRALAKFLRADLVLSFDVTESDVGIRVEGSVAGVNNFRIEDRNGSLEQISARIVHLLRVDTAYVHLLARRP
jgi:hypothetical protein